ncbi:Uncharacterised protein [Mycobacteroides abscessus subsp. abscessus]|nr:Uncharacterised protein [Mycobacteroides abscessus subsp. abscessus]
MSEAGQVNRDGRPAGRSQPGKHRSPRQGAVGVSVQQHYRRTTTGNG